MKSRIRPGAPQPPGDEPVLNPQRGVPGTERLAVYAGGYYARTREALEEVYESVRHVVGEAAFARLCRAYAARYPSMEYNLNLAGRHFAELLAQEPISRELPFLPDLARLEWAVCQAFHAFEQPPLVPMALAAWPLDAWDRVQVVFQPSVHVIASDWPVLDIWQARSTPRGQINIPLVNRPQRVLVYRDGWHVRGVLLEEPAAELLQGLLSGRSLGAVCRKLEGRLDDASTRLTEWCAQWVRLGLIIRCDTDGVRHLLRRTNEDGA
jgi:hypothetical protein